MKHDGRWKIMGSMERDERKRTSRSQQCPLLKFHVQGTVPATYSWASNPDCPY